MAIMKPKFSSLILVLCIIIFLTSFPATSARATVMSPSMSPTKNGTATPPAGSDCLTSLMNMSDCLTYTQPGSQLKTPDEGCCAELAGLVDSAPICLCQLLGNSSSFGIEIDEARALGLPKVCNVTTPPPSSCSDMGIPIGAPSSSKHIRAPASSEGTGSLTGSPTATPTTALPAKSPSQTKSKASSITRGFGLLFLAGVSSLALQFIY